MPHVSRQPVGVAPIAAKSDSALPSARRATISPVASHGKRNARHQRIGGHDAVKSFRYVKNGRVIGQTARSLVCSKRYQIARNQPAPVRPMESPSPGDGVPDKFASDVTPCPTRSSKAFAMPPSGPSKNACAISVYCETSTPIGASPP